MIIYVEHISERLIYTFDFIFKAQDISYHLTNDLNHFLKCDETKFNYSSYPSDDFLSLSPAELLFDETIQVQKLSKSAFESIECLSFNQITDPIASIFYVLTRYEEYLEFTPDEHERFRATQSVQYKYGWLNQLICDRWAKAIIDFLHKNNVVDKPFTKSATQIIPTFDIDNSFAYLHKNGWRRIVSTAKDLLKRDKKRLQERKDVLDGKTTDPYDTFSYIESIAKGGFAVRLFWHLGDYAKFDKNLSYLSEPHRQLIQRMSDTCQIGIHPSYASNSNFFLLNVETKRLQEIVKKPITTARQHFLKLRFPETYTNYLAAGIEDDYTLGFAQKIGFRAGTLRAHNWFNLKNNTRTTLTLHPFAYMDGTLLEYEKMTVTEAKNKVEALYKETIKFGGDFIFLWHNETINDYKHWKGWTEVLEFTLSLKDKSYE